MAKEDIYKLLSLSMNIGGITGNSYNDFIIFNDEKLLNGSVSLVLEIDELLELGYPKEEITKLIDNCDFCKVDPELLPEEAIILKNHAYDILDIRYSIYMENKKNEKVKKHLFKD